MALRMLTSASLSGHYRAANTPSHTALHAATTNVPQLLPQQWLTNTQQGRHFGQVGEAAAASVLGRGLDQVLNHFPRLPLPQVECEGERKQPVNPHAARPEQVGVGGRTRRRFIFGQDEGAVGLEGGESGGIGDDLPDLPVLKPLAPKGLGLVPRARRSMRGLAGGEVL